MVTASGLVRAREGAGGWARLVEKQLPPRSGCSIACFLLWSPRRMRSSAALTAATALLARLFPEGQGYSDRLTIGRIAQLGPDLVYRPGQAVDDSLTYGEYGLDHFAALMEAALALRSGGARGATFVDVGSGCGRLVVAASVIWPELSRCAGVERVPELHELAMAAAEKQVGESQPELTFVCGDAANVLSQDGELADPDIVFAYSSTWPSEGTTWPPVTEELFLTDFSEVCGTHLRPGSLVITTDRRLLSVEGRWEFKLCAELEGPNRETGGASRGYIHRVVSSQRGSRTGTLAVRSTPIATRRPSPRLCAPVDDDDDSGPPASADYEADYEAGIKAGRSLREQVAGRFLSPIIDDPGLPIADSLVCACGAMFVAALALVGVLPRPSWLTPLADVPQIRALPYVLPAVSHGAALAGCWLLGALAGNAFEAGAYSDSLREAVRSRHVFQHHSNPPWPDLT